MAGGERSYYDVLGVAADARQEDIKRAYRALAKAYHPDVNREPGADVRFKEINEANQVLSSPRKRARYDRDVLRAAMHREHEQEKSASGMQSGGKRSRVAWCRARTA